MKTQEESTRAEIPRVQQGIQETPDPAVHFDRDGTRAAE